MEGKTEKLFRDLGKKIDELIARSNISSEDIKKEVDDTIQNVKKGKDKLEKELRSFADKNEDKWKDARVHLQKAADELKIALEKVFEKSEPKK